MVVTMFLLIAGMLTAREMIEMHFNKRHRDRDAAKDDDESAAT